MERWEAIIDVAINQALAGNHRARQFLADYVIGKPLQAVQLSSDNGSPLTLSMILAVINECIPDPETRYAIAAKFYQLSSDD
jgi:hypothetical protein